jgi:hypothetical protein
MVTWGDISSASKVQLFYYVYFIEIHIPKSHHLTVGLPKYLLTARSRTQPEQLAFTHSRSTLSLLGTRRSIWLPQQLATVTQSWNRFGCVGMDFQRNPNIIEDTYCRINSTFQSHRPLRLWWFTTKIVLVPIMHKGGGNKTQLKIINIVLTDLTVKEIWWQKHECCP